jgi:hypothetical protein
MKGPSQRSDYTRKQEIAFKLLTVLRCVTAVIDLKLCLEVGNYIAWAEKRRSIFKISLPVLPSSSVYTQSYVCRYVTARVDCLSESEYIDIIDSQCPPPMSTFIYLFYISSDFFHTNTAISSIPSNLTHGPKHTSHASLFFSQKQDTIRAPFQSPK